MAFNTSNRPSARNLRSTQRHPTFTWPSASPPTLRLHGHLRELQTKVLEAEDTMALMKCDHARAHPAGIRGNRQRRLRLRLRRPRPASASPSSSKRAFASLVLRRIPNKLLTFEQIGLPTMAEQICRRPRGIFLVTGPTGSGKTTTLACMINYINENFDRHIITMEDPIEYYHKHKKSIVVQREIGVDVPSFSEALRRALRQDPDVMLVGEMRDLATIGAAITAAETGHLVFGTLHTSGAASTINRIIDAFPTDQQEQVRVQLANNLIAVLSPGAVSRASTPTAWSPPTNSCTSRPAFRTSSAKTRVFRIDSRNPDRQAIRHAVAGRQPLGPVPGRARSARKRPIDKSKVPGQMVDKCSRDAESTPDKSAEEFALPEARGRRTADAAKPQQPARQPPPLRSRTSGQIDANRARMAAAWPRRNSDEPPMPTDL